MSNTIAFFPWVSVEELLTVGPVRLIPYVRGSVPGDCQYVAQADIDTVLRAYAVRKNQLVRRVCLLEFGDWRLGQEATQTDRWRLFRARELVAFAALGKRRLFHGHFDYCNFDTYAFLIQNYQPGNAGAFAYSTRRRDGGTQNTWTAEEFTFLKPLHVASHSKVDLDPHFLGALVTADDAGLLAYEAIVEFNRANTDSQDFPTHTEVVLTKSAFEYLFRIGEGMKEFVEAFRDVIPERQLDAKPSGPLEQRWKDARPKATRPLDAWAREFCDLRGGAAHGQKRVVNASSGLRRHIWHSRLSCSHCSSNTSWARTDS
jgi:hypothetical protein